MSERKSGARELEHLVRLAAGALASSQECRTPVDASLWAWRTAYATLDKLLQGPPKD